MHQKIFILIITTLITLFLCAWYFLSQTTQETNVTNQRETTVEAVEPTVVRPQLPNNIQDAQLSFTVNGLQAHWDGPQKIMDHALIRVGRECLYMIDWGDGGNISNRYSDCRAGLTYTYNQPGTYQVKTTLFAFTESGNGPVRSWDQTQELVVGE